MVMLVMVVDPFSLLLNIPVPVCSLYTLLCIFVLSFVTLCSLGRIFHGVG